VSDASKTTKSKTESTATFLVGVDLSEEAGGGSYETTMTIPVSDLSPEAKAWQPVAPSPLAQLAARENIR